ncbi:MAG: SUMF1/EgtB/PvdO family nonheme iron enzyme, partial [Chthoniobacteraceae bacterium]|nr:SUMF1/EgtB/PvdO family nonheme iron enzyme [Chthoniobacteraceae bacterium]
VNEATYKSGKITPSVKVSANGYRLPKNAEWEFAARGGIKTIGYTASGSDDANTVGWFVENSGLNIHPVGGLKPNELGIYDMSGNVEEWCFEGENPISNFTRGGTYISGPDAGFNQSSTANYVRDTLRGFRVALSSAP